APRLDLGFRRLPAGTLDLPLRLDLGIALIGRTTLDLNAVIDVLAEVVVGHDRVLQTAEVVGKNVIGAARAPPEATGQRHVLVGLELASCPFISLARSGLRGDRGDEAKPSNGQQPDDSGESHGNLQLTQSRDASVVPEFASASDNVEMSSGTDGAVEVVE